LQGDIFFVPQRPYVVLGTLRDQMLYPTWAKFDDIAADAAAAAASGTGAMNASSSNAGSGGAANGRSGNGAASSSSDSFGEGGSSSSSSSGGGGGDGSKRQARRLPGDAELEAALRAVQLGPLLDRIGGDLDAVADWASMLSLGEQQRLAFGRVLLAKVCREAGAGRQCVAQSTVWCMLLVLSMCFLCVLFGLRSLHATSQPVLATAWLHTPVTARLSSIIFSLSVWCDRHRLPASSGQLPAFPCSPGWC
jgi:hypothetical protein